MNDLEIFVITNGRGTFDYTMKHLEKQTTQRKITVIKDMKWVDALNKCVDLCKSEFFLRVDDDMILHKHSLSYYLSRIKHTKKKKGGIYVCKLWEDWSRKPAGGLRMYSTAVTKKLRFKASRLGKVDKVFKNRLDKIGYKQIKDPSLVGLHVLADRMDQKKYRRLWRNNNATISKAEFANTFDNKIHSQRQSIPNQCKVLQEIPRLNKKYKGKFASFISNQK